jgi:hypothetical protein
MEVNAQNLLANGYLKYPDTLHQHSNCIYQKTFKGTNGIKLYFITFTEYNGLGPNEGTLQYEAGMQLNISDTEQVINIQFLHPVSLEIVESWANKLWLATGAVLYD